MALKLLEKDIHEKQDTIVSLRRQLEDIKQINLEMCRKLQVNFLLLFLHRFLAGGKDLQLLNFNAYAFPLTKTTPNHDYE